MSLRLRRRRALPFIDEPLSNQEVNRYLSLVVGRKYCLGVFPVDKVPWKKCLEKNTWTIVVNLDPHYLAGSHFVAVGRVNRDLMYFDSLCLGPCLSFPMFAEKTGLNFCTNDKPVQSIFSQACGYFAILFVLSMRVGLIKNVADMDRFTDDFSYQDWDMQNEKKCLDLISSAAVQSIKVKRNREDATVTHHGLP